MWFAYSGSRDAQLNLYLNLAGLKVTKSNWPSPRAIHLLALFTYSHSIQMSHVSDNPQNASGTLLPSKLKCDVPCHRATKRANANTNHARWTALHMVSRMRKMLLHIQNVLETLI